MLLTIYISAFHFWSVWYLLVCPPKGTLICSSTNQLVCTFSCVNKLVLWAVVHHRPVTPSNFILGDGGTFFPLTSNLHAQKIPLLLNFPVREKDKEHSNLRMYFMIIEKAIKSSASKPRYIIQVYLPEAGLSRALTRLRCDGHKVMDAVSQAIWRWQHSYPGYW